MIAYFDTSALMPVIIDEPTSGVASELWAASDRVVSATVVYAEARAALAQAHRLGRLDVVSRDEAVGQLDELYPQIDRVAIDETLVRRAGILAQEQALRGYDAIHLAAAEAVADDELVVVAGDAAVCAGAAALGLHTSQLGDSDG